MGLACFPCIIIPHNYALLHLYQQVILSEQALNTGSPNAILLILPISSIDPERAPLMRDIERGIFEECSKMKNIDPVMRQGQVALYQIQP